MAIHYSIYYYEPGWKNVPIDLANSAMAGYNIRNSVVANVTLLSLNYR